MQVSRRVFTGSSKPTNTLSIFIQKRFLTADYPCRSVLFAPGSRADVLEKTRKLHADAVVLDLEDAVAPTSKDVARDIVVREVSKGGFGLKRVAIRINPLNTPWGNADLERAATSGAHALVIPKVENAEQIHQVAHIMKAFGAPKEMEIWGMIETPRGILKINQIAQSHPRLTALLAGTSDLSKELKCATTRNREALIPSLAQVVLACRAHNLLALDGVHLSLKDDEEFEFQCVQGKKLGFNGKTLIHPKTIDFTNKTFSPTEETICRSLKVIKAFEEATERGDGIVVVDGNLVENLHFDEARNLLKANDRIKKMNKSGE